MYLTRDNLGWMLTRQRPRATEDGGFLVSWEDDTEGRYISWQRRPKGVPDLKVGECVEVEVVRRKAEQ